MSTHNLHDLESEEEYIRFQTLSVTGLGLVAGLLSHLLKFEAF